MSALQDTGPNYTEICESDDLIQQCQFLEIVVMVVVEEVVAVLSCWIFSVPDHQKHVHYGPKSKYQD